MSSRPLPRVLIVPVLGLSLRDLAETTHPQVNINTATLPELALLPGVGRVLGFRIIVHRATHGPYTVKEQLKQVPGVNGRSFARLSEFVVVSGPTTLHHKVAVYR